MHRFDPARGFNADPLVLAGGGAVLGLVLLALLAVLAWRAVRPAGREPARRPSAIAAAAASAGLPVPAVIGARQALERRSGQRPAAVRAALVGSVAAVTAVVMAPPARALPAQLADPGPAQPLGMSATELCS